jgi:Helix-turn-helix domain
LKTRPVRKSSEKPTHQRIAYGPREVSEMTGVSESGVRNLIYRGSLKAVRWDGRWLVPAHVLETYFGVQLAESTAPVSPTDESPTQ